MDFTSNQTTEEVFDPETISTRSEQNSSDESTDRPARGIPERLQIMTYYC